jgi:hypothetical protein
MNSKGEYYVGFEGDVNFYDLPVGTIMEGLNDGHKYELLSKNPTIILSRTTGKKWNLVGNYMKILGLPGEEQEELWV